VRHFVVDGQSRQNALAHAFIVDLATVMSIRQA
jgi:hypothetical protein